MLCLVVIFLSFLCSTMQNEMDNGSNSHLNDSACEHKSAHNVWLDLQRMLWMYTAEYSTWNLRLTLEKKNNTRFLSLIKKRSR